MNKPIFIAEIKTKSMFGFESPYNRGKLIDTALEYGDWISVHTDPRFGGSFDDIYFLRQETDKPILAKGFHTHDDDVKRALDAGADYVLVVDRFPFFSFKNYKCEPIIEISDMHDESYFRWKNLGLNKVLYNSRNIRNGYARVPAYSQYREQYSWLCGASGLLRYEDVERDFPNCDAFIVGSHLIEFCKTL